MHHHRFPSLATAALVMFVAVPAAAQVTVTDAWVRGTVAGQKATGAFMQLDDARRHDARRRGVAGGQSRRDPRDGAGRRRDEDARRRALALPAGKTVDLKPGGYHVMLMDLTQPLKEGDTMPVTLTFDDKTGRKITQEIKAPVRALTAATPGAKR